MTKIDLKGVDAKSLCKYMERCDIGSSQTFRITEKEINSRAYPKSKSYFLSNVIEIDELGDDISISQPQFTVDFPCRDVANFIKAIKFFGDEKIDMKLHCLDKKVGKIDMKLGKKKFSIIAGGGVPPFLPQEVFSALSSTDNAELEVSAKADDIANILKMHNICKTDNEDVTIQLVYENGEVVFSSAQDMDEQVGDDWKYPIQPKTGKIEGSRFELNSKFISKMKEYDSDVYFLPKDETTKIMVFKNETCIMVNVLVKRI